MAQKVRVDIYNYFSIAILESVGIEAPDQIQIDKVENLLKKITKTIRQRFMSETKPPRGRQVE